MSFALVVGALMAADRVSREALPLLDTTTPVEDCRVSLGLVGVDSRSPISRSVDRYTGRRGFSHVFVDPCRSVDGVRSIVNYTVTRGVHWAPASTYAGRRVELVELDEQTGRELWGCVRGRIGRPFALGPMAVAFPTAANCVGLVVSCLPGTLRAQLAPLIEGVCLSPNTLARYYGVAS